MTLEEDEDKWTIKIILLRKSLDLTLKFFTLVITVQTKTRRFFLLSEIRTRRLCNTPENEMIKFTFF